MNDATLVNLAAYSAQVLIVVSAGAIGLLIVRLSSARARLGYWRLIVTACLFLPFFAPMRSEVLFVPQPAADVPLTMTGMEISDGGGGTRVSTAALVSWILVAGFAVRGAWLGVGIVALGRLRRKSQPGELHSDIETLRKAVAPGAEIRWHGAVTQPVAFGLRRPIVLLPRTVALLPPDAQRAVVCHELLHVARRDWAWMLAEEAIRCVLWFHPAIWFALGRLQLSREELVDEQVVQITGVRKAYARALAMFAGEPAFAAATPFIRRRHLLSRIRQLSEEHTMSPLRVACAFAVLMVVVAASSWTAAFAMPLRLDGTTVLRVPSAAEQEPLALPPIDPATVQTGSPVRNQDAGAAQRQQQDADMAKLARAAAELREAARQARMHTPVAGQAVSPLSTVVYRVAPVYPEQAKGHGVEAIVTVGVTVGTAGEVTNVEAVRTRLTTEQDINDPAFWASQPSRLFGQAAEDAVRQWRFEPTGTSRRFELSIAFGEPNQMMFAAAPRATLNLVESAPGVIAPQSEIRPGRVRVGGMIRQPSMVSKVDVVYPPAAKEANIQGVVIIEIVIGTDGSVKEAWVRRSIPMLDQAALDAVRQWKYQPTLLNGAPVEVIATVTVNFTQQ